MDCIAPCDGISLDSDVYELSIGTFEEEEQSARMPFWWNEMNQKRPVNVSIVYY
jgi:hypothetical protein